MKRKRKKRKLKKSVKKKSWWTYETYDCAFVSVDNIDTTFVPWQPKRSRFWPRSSSLEFYSQGIVIRTKYRWWETNARFIDAAKKKKMKKKSHKNKSSIHVESDFLYSDIVTAIGNDRTWDNREECCQQETGIIREISRTVSFVRSSAWMERCRTLLL